MGGWIWRCGVTGWWFWGVAGGGEGLGEVGKGGDGIVLKTYILGCDDLLFVVTERRGTEPLRKGKGNTGGGGWENADCVERHGFGDQCVQTATLVPPSLLSYGRGIRKNQLTQ